MAADRIEQAKARAQQAIGGSSAELVRISREIHAHPELAFEERYAYGQLVPFVQSLGFDVQEHAYGMETAFRGEWGHGAVTVAICAEYDALPGIGHGCGHNLIATSGVGAAAGLKSALEPGDARVVILGTPAEEGLGGKVRMVQRGCFDDVDAAMMAHPSPADILDAPMFGVAHVDVEYRGKAVHASVFPERGVNALDALVLAYQSIALLRHHIRRDARLHGIIRHGGDAPNIIPEYTSGSFYVRALKPSYLEELKTRVRACFEAAALATGCTLTMDWHEAEEYAPMLHNRPMAERYRRNGEALGKQFYEMRELTSGSSDMGNVSQVVPSIHPNFGVGTLQFTHSPEFTAASITDAAHAAMLQTAEALAMTGVDIALEPGLIGEIRRDFRAATERGGGSSVGA